MNLRVINAQLSVHDYGGKHSKETSVIHSTLTMLMAQRHFTIFNSHENCQYYANYFSKCGPGSVVFIATGYGLDGPGIESPLGRDLPHLSRPALGPTQPPVQWVPGLSLGVKSGRSVTLTPHPLLVPLIMKE